MLKSCFIPKNKQLFLFTTRPLYQLYGLVINRSLFLTCYSTTILNPSTGLEFQLFLLSLKVTERWSKFVKSSEKMQKKILEAGCCGETVP